MGKISPSKEENQQIQQTYSIDDRIKPRPRWVNASAIASASTLRMLFTKLHSLLRFDESLSFSSIYLSSVHDPFHNFISRKHDTMIIQER